MIPSIQTRVKVPIRVDKKGEMFISSCPTLDVYSQGETVEAAKRNIAEAIKIFISTCLEHGTLSAVLKECGFIQHSGPPIDESCDDDNDCIDVPIELLAYSQEAAEACHA